jgi:sulfoxide reductase heme-binding subunit YedZ
MDFLSLASASGHIAALVTNPTLWYITRATAVASYMTLSLAVILGLLQSIARTAHERLPWLVDETHQFISTLTGVLILGHLTALYFDPFLPFSLLNLLTPLNEPSLDKPNSALGVICGVFALYCMLALLFSSWLRRRLPFAFWRGVHYFSFIAFALVTAHGWLAGSDADEPWMRGLYVGASGAIVFLVLMRLFTHPHAESAKA